jgi:hypothetical protein
MVNSSRSFFEDERNLQLDAVFQDLSFTVQFDLLVLNPCGLDVLQRFLRATPAFIAASKLSGEDAMISLTFATDME